VFQIKRGDRGSALLSRHAPLLLENGLATNQYCPIKNWLVQLLAVLAKRLMDKGPQFVGAHVLKVRKLARLISLRPTRKADHRSG
jgi:hypothetical protein